MSNSTSFKKGHKPWNTGLYVRLSPKSEFKKGCISTTKGKCSKVKFICKVCKKIFEDYSCDKRITCSPKCQRLNARGNQHGFKRGKPPWNKGKCGAESHVWKGGKSFEPYTSDFNNTLREAIRFRDGYKCQLCGCPQLEHPTKLPIHHIDYNKKNNKSTNLVALCNSCNARVNFKRNYWKRHFKKLMKEKI